VGRAARSGDAWGWSATVGAVQGGRKLTVSLLAAVAGLLALAPAANAQAPSFVHIFTDDQSIDSVRHMPHTRQLVARPGKRFTNYHVTQPLCCPSRGTFLSGQYPHNHGVLRNYGPEGPLAFDIDNTLYTALQDAGYRTGWIGKVFNAVENDPLEPAPGFDEWLVPRRRGALNMLDYWLNDNGEIRKFNGVYQNRVYRERALEFIAGTPAHRPLMLTVATATPHWVGCPPGSDANRCPPTPDPDDLRSLRGERFDFTPNFRGGRPARQKANRWWRRELEALQSVDRMVRDIVEELRSRGRLGRTYVIFQSDNGHLHGQHGIFDKNAPWDRSVRVPLMIRGPGFEASTPNDDLTANVDLPLTMLELAGVQPPVPPDGHSLLGDRKRRVLLIERLRGPDKRRWRQVKRRDGWTYWTNSGTGRRHLYDLRRDPYQVKNLARKRPRLANRLDRRLNAIADCANPCP
jgi:N-acetylglucosamine-6-sulfatase